MADRLIFISASEYEVGAAEGRVGLRLSPYAGEEMGIAPGYQVVLTLSPNESRQLAQALVRWAAKAEGPRAQN